MFVMSDFSQKLSPWYFHDEKEQKVNTIKEMYKVGDEVAFTAHHTGEEIQGSIEAIFPDGVVVRPFESDGFTLWTTDHASLRKLEKIAEADPIEKHIEDYVVLEFNDGFYGVNYDLSDTGSFKTRTAAESASEKLARERGDGVFSVAKIVSFSRSETKSYTIRTDE